jgi:hypothetical protein
MSSVHRSGTESRASTAIDRSDSPAKDQSWRNPDYLATPNVAESGPLGQVSCAASAISQTAESYNASSGLVIGHAGPQAVDRAASGVSVEVAHGTRHCRCHLGHLPRLAGSLTS